MKVRTKEVTGVLKTLLENIDEKELAKTRKRMMLAAKIEEAMKRCGYNQKQFAHLMKKSPAVISEWLSGDRNFTVDTLIDIEEALGIRLLDASLLVAVKSGGEISQKVSSNQVMASVNSQGLWHYSERSIHTKVVYNCG